MKNKSQEYENILKKVDDILYKKENEIEQLNSQIKNLNNRIKKQKEDLDDMSKEKEDLQNSVSTLSAQVDEQKKLLKNDKTEKEYKALIEILNDNISALEKKIIKLEDTSIINEASKEKLINSLDFKINEFQSQINSLTQKKNNSIIKKSQNEIKINLISSEKNIDYNKNEKINEEIREIQKENFDLLVDQESITKKVEIIETQIKTTKKLNKNLKSILDKYNKKNKSELIMSLAKKEIENIILNDCVKAYDNILMNNIELQHDDKFNLYKVENDLNNLINKSSLLLNNYLNHINKLDDINKELEIIMNEPDNYDKLNQMRENIELLIEESDEINNITKNYNSYNSRNINNISFDKCPNCLENIISNMSENFLILIETYNVTNSNICQLISLMEESYCYKKKFISNLSSFVQENVKDAFTKQNTLYKLNELLKSKIEEKEYNNKIEQIIRELFRKITLNLSEKDKENKILNKRINLYMKQIDENVKKININNKRILTNRVPSMTLNKSVNDNEINKLKFRLNTQQKTLSSTKNNIKKMNLSINKVDELIKSRNFKTNEIETNKITSALAECKNVVQKMSRGLNTESNKNKISINLNFNKKTKSYNELLKQSIQRENYVNVKNLKDKNLPKQIFKQYFINLSKFSKTIIDYGLNDNDNNDDKDL
jgi:exonuclease SbcC